MSSSSHTSQQSQKPTRPAKSASSAESIPVFTGKSGQTSSILQLHRMIGNQAVQRLIRDKGNAREVLQGQYSKGQTPSPRRSDRNAVENRRGIPLSLKSALEALSGMDLSGVQVHYNSSKPAHVNALAYTQGRDIHLGPLQEAHLPHEGWHAVQQMQGKVKPTIQAKGLRLSDDAKLEHEADVMGAKALQQKSAGNSRRFAHSKPPQFSAQGARPTIQRAMKFEFQTRNYVWQVDRRGRNPKPLGRKLGREGYSEDGSKPTFLAVGRQGYPEVRVGDMVKAKGDEVDKSKPGQYIVTYRVTRDPKGKFSLDGVPVSLTLVSHVNNRRVKGMKGKYNRGIYEFNYLDGDNHDREMNVHRDPTGNFQHGKIKRMRKAKKADLEEGTAIELQSESKGFLEFETPKWFRSWCALRLRVREAYDMTQAIKSSPELKDEKVNEKIERKIPHLIEAGKRYSSHDKIGRIVEWPAKYKTDRLPLGGGRLILEIVNEDWEAYIQSSEGISLTQYESLLKEHRPSEAVRSIRYAKEILKGGSIDRAKAPNLYSFLQMIGYYIERGQDKKYIMRKTGRPGPSKFAFPLMSRTSFSSIYSALLTPEEQKLFAELVQGNKILTAINKVNRGLDLKESSKFFKYGHGGAKNRPLKIMEWLKSIIDPEKYGRKIYNREEKRDEFKDLLSPPKSGAAAMGRFQVEQRAGKKDTNLVKFEVRRRSGNVKPASAWEAYAEMIFKQAAKSRKRDDQTGLIYDEKETCPETYFEHQKAKEEKKKAKTD